MDKKFRIYICATEESFEEKYKEIVSVILDGNKVDENIEYVSGFGDDDWDEAKAKIDNCDYFAVIITDEYNIDNGKGMAEKCLEYAMSIDKVAFVLGHARFKEKEWFDTINDPDAGYIAYIHEDSCIKEPMRFIRIKESEYGRLHTWYNEEDLLQSVMKDLGADIDALMEIEQEETNTKKKKSICRYEKKMISPRFVEEAHIVVDYLKDEVYVIELDLEKADMEEAQRILDFITGAVYMSEGTCLHLKEKRFLVAPKEYEVYD